MPRTFSLYGVSIEISIVFIYRLYLEVVRKRTCIMSTILFNFNVHIQALNIHPLAPLAPLREFFLAGIFCVIYISRQAANLARRYSECILAPFAPLRDHNISCARTITSCEIYFSPSRQGRKVYILIYLSAIRAFARS